jgi:hypothetical protein
MARGSAIRFSHVSKTSLVRRGVLSHVEDIIRKWGSIMSKTLIARSVIFLYFRLCQVGPEHGTSGYN